MKSPARYGPAYAAVTTLFLAWGFITSLIDPLVAAVKGIFSLTDVQAQLSAFAFFIAYGVMSFPAAAILSRFKSVPTILMALGTMIGGCILMLIAANIENYTLVLGGLFVLAGGITALQVAANPLAAALGSPEGSHFRLTFSQAFNSFGTFIGPIIGASLFLEGIEVKPGMEVTEAARAEALAGIDAAYFWLSGMIAMLLVFFFLSRKIVSEAAPDTSSTVIRRGILSMLKEATQSKWALLGGMAIFLYVGAEVAIGTQMAFFLNADSIWGQSDAAFKFPLISWLFTSDGIPGISLQEAAAITAIYWGGAMVGRLIGSALLAKVNAALLLAVFTGGAALMCLYVFIVGGVSAGFVALAIGLFNSIMFPVIFSLTLERSTASAEATSGFLCTAIIGGAFVPLLVGLVSGHSSYITAFIVPAACYVILCWFALSARKVQATNNIAEVVTSH
ncbi:sugar fucose permease family protein [Cellvibrio sp. BR]|uniref:MFS transporter n=1 Tax=Cellvibrio sp. BR TaxID=1134474 RepID=UPI000260185B|nr:MFS transporter [Cellvibrio sp. BR]EIK45464.1 sugar fucose permease family protein [Cellvibrio sp. BR]